MDREEHICPACGQPVETVVQRHKTLGAWVPRWVAGPCRNPDCEAYVPEGAEHDQRHGHGHPHEHRHGQPHEQERAREGEDTRAPEPHDTGGRRR